MSGQDDVGEICTLLMSKTSYDVDPQRVGVYRIKPIKALKLLHQHFVIHEYRGYNEPVRRIPEYKNSGLVIRRTITDDYIELKDLSGFGTRNQIKPFYLSSTKRDDYPLNASTIRRRLKRQLNNERHLSPYALEEIIKALKNPIDKQLLLAFIKKLKS